MDTEILSDTWKQQFASFIELALAASEKLLTMFSSLYFIDNPRKRFNIALDRRPFS